MNEKFRKDEVWGSLGKATTKIEGVQDNLNPGNMEYHGMVPNHKVGLRIFPFDKNFFPLWNGWTKQILFELE